MNEIDEIVINDRDKILNYTEDDIRNILNIIKDNVRYDRFIVSKGENRKDNDELINEYNLTNEKIKKLLLSIDVKDFCYGTHDDKDKKTILYVFAKDAKVFEITDVSILVKIYVKIKLTKTKPRTVVVISLHKLKYKIDYLFK